MIFFSKNSVELYTMIIWWNLVISSGFSGIPFSGQKRPIFEQYFTKKTNVLCSSSRWRNCVVLINMTDNLWNYTIVCILHCDFFQTSQNLFSTKSSTWVAFVFLQKLKICTVIPWDRQSSVPRKCCLAQNYTP